MRCVRKPLLFFILEEGWDRGNSSASLAGGQSESLGGVSTVDPSSPSVTELLAHCCWPCRIRVLRSPLLTITSYCFFKSLFYILILILIVINLTVTAYSQSK